MLRRFSAWVLLTSAATKVVAPPRVVGRVGPQRAAGPCGRATGALRTDAPYQSRFLLPPLPSLPRHRRKFPRHHLALPDRCRRTPRNRRFLPRIFLTTAGNRPTLPGNRGKIPPYHPVIPRNRRKNPRSFSTNPGNCAKFPAPTPSQGNYFCLIISYLCRFGRFAAGAHLTFWQPVARTA